MGPNAAGPDPQDAPLTRHQAHGEVRPVVVGADAERAPQLGWRQRLAGGLEHQRLQSCVRVGVQATRAQDGWLPFRVAPGCGDDVVGEIERDEERRAAHADYPDGLAADLERVEALSVQLRTTGGERERPSGMSAVDADDVPERGERIAELMTETLALATPCGQPLDAACPPADHGVRVRMNSRTSDHPAALATANSDALRSKKLCGAPV